MKKIIVLLSLVYFFTSCKKVIYECSNQEKQILVKSPSKTDTLIIGKKALIEFSSSMNDHYSVFLIGGGLGPNGSKFIGTTSNNSSFEWVVPNVPPDSGYQIQLSNASQGLNGFSERFTISTGSAIPTIGFNGEWTKVTYPNGKEVLKAGTDVIIRWESKNPNGSVSIGYSFGPGSLNWIQFSGPNSGSYVWTIPSGLKDRRLKISVSANGVEDQSDDFFSIQ